MSAPPAVLAGWQQVLAAEQRAVFGYALLGPRLAAGEQPLARADQAAHTDARDAAVAALAAAGARPVPPQADYPALYGIAPHPLAAQLEDDCATAWRYLYAGAAASPGQAAVRGPAQRGLTDSAVRAVRWRLLAGAARPVVAFPGIP